MKIKSFNSNWYGNKSPNHSLKHSLNHNNHFSRITSKDLVDGGVKGEDETPIGIDQRMVNQKDPSQMVIGVMLPEMTEGNKDVSDADKRDILKGTAWQKTSICTKRKKKKKT